MVPPVDIAFIAQEIARLGEEVERAADESGETRPSILRVGLLDLVAALREVESETSADCANALRARTGTEPGALLLHGLDLLIELSQAAARVHQPHAARALERLSLPLTCWLLRCGAELARPEPVVNAAAALANSLNEPEHLAELYALMSEVIEGMSPLQVQEPEGGGPSRSWRVLLLNRAIVATRSHRPALMVEAFRSVCEQLPEEAADFFREGMGQMETQGYPQTVRDVMERYYDVWCAGQRLH